jgi:hypothetical protein
VAIKRPIERVLIAAEATKPQKNAFDNFSELQPFRQLLHNQLPKTVHLWQFNYVAHSPLTNLHSHILTTPQPNIYVPTSHISLVISIFAPHLYEKNTPRYYYWLSAYCRSGFKNICKNIF